MSIAVDVGAGAFLAVAGFNVSWILTKAAESGLRRLSAEHRAHDRARLARAALAEASLEDPRFALEEVRDTVDAILAVAEHVWRDGHQGWSGTARPDGAYIERWARSVLTDFGEGAQMTGKPAIDVLGVVNRPDESDAQILLRVRLRFHTTYPLPVPSIARTDLRWTLTRKDDTWSLLSIDTHPLTDPLLERPLVPAAWADDERLREASLTELGEEDAAPREDLSDLIVADMPAAQQLIELAQLDGRFDPDLLNARLVHILEAWEQASMGPTSRLWAVATPQAGDVLLSPPSPGHQEPVRLVLRDAVLERWKALKLLVSAAPYRIHVSVSISASIYLVRWPQGTYLTGEVRARQEIDLSWTLELTEPAAWQLIASNDPALRATGLDGSQP